jgi:alpha-beta hydrolase superfamily lysophospholipase
MKTKSSDGYDIVFDVSGRGAPVLLLHGFSQSRTLWSRFGWVERLSRNYSVIVMDMRGCGESGAPIRPDEYSVARHVADVDSVLEGLAIERCAVWGWSFGGTLALHLAKRGSKIASALVAGTHFGRVFTDQYIRGRSADTSDPVTRARWEGLRSWPAVEPAELKCRTAVYSGTNDGNVVVQLESRRDEIESAGIELCVFPDLRHGELLSKVGVVDAFVRRHL